MVKIALVFDGIFALCDILETKFLDCETFNPNEQKFYSFLCWNDFVAALERNEEYDVVYLDVLFNINLLPLNTSTVIYEHLPDAKLIYLHSNNDFVYPLQETRKRATHGMPLKDDELYQVFTEVCAEVVEEQKLKNK